MFWKSYNSNSNKINNKFLQPINKFIGCTLFSFQFLLIQSLPAFSFNLTIDGREVPTVNSNTCPLAIVSPEVEQNCYLIPVGNYGDFSIQNTSPFDPARNVTQDGTIDILRTTGLRIVSNVDRLLNVSITSEEIFSSPPPLPNDPLNRGIFNAEIEGYFAVNGAESNLSTLLSTHFLNGVEQANFSFESSGLGRTNFNNSISREVTLNQGANTLKHILNFNIRGQGSFILIPGSQVTSITVSEPTSTLSLLALGTLGAASTLKRKLKSFKSTVKELEKVS